MLVHQRSKDPLADKKRISRTCSCRFVETRSYFVGELQIEISDCAGNIALQQRGFEQADSKSGSHDRKEWRANKDDWFHERSRILYCKIFCSQLTSHLVLISDRDVMAAPIFMQLS